jgi:hypothetical protein
VPGFRQGPTDADQSQVHPETDQSHKEHRKSLAMGLVIGNDSGQGGKIVNILDCQGLVR